MGRLIDQPIKTFFHGVSRQPDPLRLPGQLEDAVNSVFSVETGGFSKRLGAQIIRELPGVPTVGPVGLHLINRDPTERYVVLHTSGSLQVFDLEGNAKTVNAIPADAVAYLTADSADMAFVTVADYTFILNRNVVVEMDSYVEPAPAKQAVVKVDYVRDSQYTITLNGTVTGAHTGTNTMDYATMAEGLKNALIGALAGDASNWSITRDSSYIFIKRNDGADFTISGSDPTGAALVIAKESVKKSTELPARAPNGMVLSVEGESKAYYLKFKAEPGSNRGYWRETVKPGQQVRFKAETMPYQMVRNADGTFTVSKAQWNDKKAGDEDTVPRPDYVGRKIADMTFWRNRLVLIAGETAYFSQAGDFFNMWPDYSTEVLDSDPFGVTGQSDGVATLRFAVPFRKTLFATADAAQFEVSADLVTPKKTVIDLSTAYEVSTMCRPLPLGDSLFFASDTGDSASILEYLYEESSLTNTAADITKHCKGFLPKPVVQLVGDAVLGSMYARSTATPDQLYTYTFYWNGDERAQSAWGRWKFNGVDVIGCGVIASHLYFVGRKAGKTFLYRVALSVTGYSKYTFRTGATVPPCLDDEWRSSDGVYDAETGLTTFSGLPFDPVSGVVALTSSDFGAAAMRNLRVTRVNETTLTAKGDWSGGEVMFGFPFDSYVVLSKQYVRDEGGASVVNGRYQVRTLTLYFKDTGFLEVAVQPKQRDEKVARFTGRFVGSAANIVGQNVVDSGTLKAPVWSDGSTVTITIRNNTFMPHTVTNATMIGFFNEVSRQG